MIVNDLPHIVHADVHRQQLGRDVVARELVDAACQHQRIFRPDSSKPSTAQFASAAVGPSILSYEWWTMK
jgi:hypothetical protein